jgi:hypothetical protein
MRSRQPNKLQPTAVLSSRNFGAKADGATTYETGRKSEDASLCSMYGQIKWETSDKILKKQFLYSFQVITIVNINQKLIRSSAGQDSGSRGKCNQVVSQ